MPNRTDQRLKVGRGGDSASEVGTESGSIKPGGKRKAMNQPHEVDYASPSRRDPAGNRGHMASTHSVATVFRLESELYRQPEFFRILSPRPQNPKNRSTRGL